MHAMIRGLRICWAPSPMYSNNLMKSYRRNVPIKLRTKRTLGIIKRFIKGKI